MSDLEVGSVGHVDLENLIFDSKQKFFHTFQMELVSWIASCWFLGHLSAWVVTFREQVHREGVSSNVGPRCRTLLPRVLVLGFNNLFILSVICDSQLNENQCSLCV